LVSCIASDARISQALSVLGNDLLGVTSEFFEARNYTRKGKLFVKPKGSLYRLRSLGLPNDVRNGPRKGHGAQTNDKDKRRAVNEELIKHAETDHWHTAPNDQCIPRWFFFARHDPTVPFLRSGK